MKGKRKGSKKQEGILENTGKDLAYEVGNSLFDLIVTLGMASFIEEIEDEVRKVCGDRYKHQSNREYMRWSAHESPVIFGGRKISIRHPRVRNIRTKTEKQIETIQQYKDRELLSLRQMEQMIIGVSTRKYRRSLETGIDGLEPYGDSKSTVSRNFVAKTLEKLKAWRDQLINELYPIIMIDGIVYAGTTVIIALGINKTGDKKVLGAWEGSTENSRVCIDLLQNLIERGFDPSACKLAVIDGSKALRKALDDVFGKRILVQRCQVHKKKNVAEYLPKEKRESAQKAMSEAYNAESYAIAKRSLLNLVKHLEKEYPQAARSLTEGMEETLTLHKLKAHKKIRKSLCTTNPIESLNSGIRNITRRVKRWRNSDMVIRWVCTGIIESEKNFRKINGHMYIEALLKNIERMGENILEENSKAA